MDHAGAEMLTGDAGHTTWTWHSPKPTAHAIPWGGAYRSVSSTLGSRSAVRYSER